METAAKAEAPRPAPTLAKPEVAAVPAAPARKRRPFVVLAVIAAIALVSIGGYSLATRGRESTDDAQVTADMVPVAARVGGAVAKVHIKENQVVKRGDLLVELDAADLLAKQQQAEAELATAQAQAQAADAQVQIVDATSRGGLASARAALTGFAAGVGSADAQLASAKAAAARADTDLNKAEVDFQRAETLHKAAAMSQQQYDAARSTLEAARASKAQAEAQVKLAEDARRTAESRVGEAKGRVDQSAPVAPQIAAARANAALAEARVRSAEAQLALAKLQVSYTRIVAPANGWASKLSVHEGQLVSVGQPLVELVPSETYMVASFKETQIGKMRPGQPAKIEIDAFPGRELEGRVESLAGGTGASFSLLPPDNATGNFVKVVQRVPVRITLVDVPADVVLRPGLSADVTVDTR
ncbi:MAG TPA: HlyD family secretion protein [Polyangia bacterium]|jgi:membrane fusion protein (multidrug efflux system)|nr:HlyD family secretion protein [Polyangia bacterium]